MSKTFSRKITMYSFIMSLLIVLYHMSIFNYYKISCTSGLDKTLYVWFSRFFDSVSAIALGFFFTTSSFLFYVNANKQNIIYKMKKRFKTLGIPFIIWNIIEYIFLILAYGYSANRISNILLLATFDPFNGPLWYVFELIVITILSPVIIKYKNRKIKENIFKFIIITLFCFSFSIVYNNGIIPSGLYWLERAIRYLPAYLLGIFFAWYGKRIYLEKYNFKKVEIISRIVSIVAFILIITRGRLSENSDNLA